MLSLHWFWRKLGCSDAYEEIRVLFGNPGIPISRGPPGAGIPTSIRHHWLAISFVLPYETKDRDPTLTDRRDRSRRRGSGEPQPQATAPEMTDTDHGGGEDDEDLALGTIFTVSSQIMPSVI
jgi:hypothetical protein